MQTKEPSSRLTQIRTRHEDLCPLLETQLWAQSIGKVNIECLPRMLERGGDGVSQTIQPIGGVDRKREPRGERKRD